MRIGLISINMHTKSLNFACPLHTWAFQQFLLQHGIDSEVIDYTPNYYENFPARDPVPFYEQKYQELLKCEPETEEGRLEWEKKLGNYQRKRDGYTALREERILRFDRFDAFIKENYRKTDKAYDEELLDREDSGFDCYICVTDVIWACDEYWGFDAGFLLDCYSMENKWKIAYAASRGIPKELPEIEKAYFARAVNDIDFVSTREPSLKDDIHKLLPEKEVKTVLDPVLLLDAKAYENILIKPEIENYIVIYYAMERPKDLLKSAIYYAKKNDYKIVELTHIPIEGGFVRTNQVEVINDFAAGPREWLGYLKYAECIFTNSFHATCFSILFHKRFFVGKRNGDKVSNVLETFGLQDRTISVLEESIQRRRSQKNLEKKYHSGLIRLGIEQQPGDEKINYRKVDKILNEKRKESADFILSAIEYAQTHEKPRKDYDVVRKSIHFGMAYYSNMAGAGWCGGTIENRWELREINGGRLEYRMWEAGMKNSGEETVKGELFEMEGSRFEGWFLRIRIKHTWYWVLKDGSLVLRNKSYKPSRNKEKTLFRKGDKIPYIPVRMISVMIADAKWSSNTK